MQENFFTWLKLSWMILELACIVGYWPEPILDFGKKELMISPKRFTILFAIN